MKYNTKKYISKNDVVVFLVANLKKTSNWDVFQRVGWLSIILYRTTYARFFFAHSASGVSRAIFGTESAFSVFVFFQSLAFVAAAPTDECK